MAKLRLGDTDLATALRSQALTLDGPTQWLRHFGHWFHLSRFASIERPARHLR